MSAGGTAIAMAAECGSATACDREQDLLMLPADPATTAFHKARTGTANDIGHLQRRPVYGLRLCSPDGASVSASRGLAVARGWRWAAGGEGGVSFTARCPRTLVMVRRSAP